MHFPRVVVYLMSVSVEVVAVIVVVVFVDYEWNNAPMK
jgi:hypothetical protein